VDCLSVDIDVNYVGAIEKEQMDAERPSLEDRIERLMARRATLHGASRPSTLAANGSTAMPARWAGRNEIDINYLYRSPLYGVDRMPSTTIGPYRATNVPVLDIHEIAAGKSVTAMPEQACAVV
jgi:sRNA-binding protein